VLTSRERVLCALAHEEPDQIPVFFGSTGNTSMLAPGYVRFREYLGVPGEWNGALLSRVFRYAEIEEPILLRLGSDARPLMPGPPPSVARDVDADTFVDDWGTIWQLRPGTIYNEVLVPPLRDITVDQIEAYPWPDLGHPSRFAGLRERAEAIRDRGFAVVAATGASPFETIAMMRGYDAWLLDLVADPELAHALMSKLTEVMLAGVTGLLRAVGDVVDIVAMADDLGDEAAPLLSPSLYRALVKPYHARLIAEMKRLSPAKVFLHSCGDIYALIPDLIDVGVEILNPVQVSAGAMTDTARLKREFGAFLTFCGAIDTQWALPFGSVADVRAEVRRRIADLGPGGGYILASVHCIQPDVPPENVCAMLDEARASGRYPLAGQCRHSSARGLGLEAEPALAEADVARLREHDVVQHLDVEQASGRDEARSHADVFG